MSNSSSNIDRITLPSGPPTDAVGLWAVLAGALALCVGTPARADITFDTSAAPSVAAPWQDVTFAVSADPTGTDALQQQCQLTTRTWTWTVSADAGCTASVDPATATVDSTTVDFNSAIAGEHSVTIGCTIVTVSSCGTDTASGSVSLTVDVANVALKVRRRGAANWGSSATVAAGGRPTPEHEADVLATLTDAQGNPVAHVKIGKPVISDPSGVDSNASITPDSATTGSDGTASFTFVSSDITRTITATLGNGSATIGQVWDEVPDGSDWSYNAYFYYDAPSGVTFTPLFFDGATPVHITDHNIDFVVLSLDLWVWDDTLGDYVYEPGQPPDPALASFSPGTAADSGGGTYTSGLMVTYDPKSVVDTVTFDVEDDNSWAP